MVLPATGASTTPRLDGTARATTAANCAEHLQSLHAANRRGGGRPAERGWAIAAALVAVLLPVALVVLRSI